MLIAVHATRPRPLCSRVGHSVAFAACLPPIEHLWDLGRPFPVEPFRALGDLIWRAALTARTLSICLAMDAFSAEQHPSRKAAFLPCASRPPDFRVFCCLFRPPPKSRKQTARAVTRAATRAAAMSDTADLKHEADDAGDTPLSFGDADIATTPGALGAPTAAAGDRKTKFHTGDVPGLDPTLKVTVSHELIRLYYGLPEHLGIAFSFILVFISVAKSLYDASMRQGAAESETQWMADHTTTDRERLEQLVYNQLKTYLSDFTDALEIFSDITAHHSRCAGLVWDKLLHLFPPDSPKLRNQVLMKELGRALHPKLQSLDDYNKHCHDVAKGLSYLSSLPPIDIRELFAIAQVSALTGYDDAYLDKAYLDIINAVNDGTTLTHDLVKTKLRGQLKLRNCALARDGTRSSAVALKASFHCSGRLQCPLHCKDPKTGKWRPPPSTKGPSSSRRAMQAAASDPSGDDVEDPSSSEEDAHVYSARTSDYYDDEHEDYASGSHFSDRAIDRAVAASDARYRRPTPRRSRKS
jgi:hypothetical protein